MATLVLSIILTVCFGLRVTDGQALGFVLNGVTYPNGSTVLRTDIGEGEATLNCTTDSVTCCTNQNGETRAGNIYFPDGSVVLTQGSTPSSSYYRTRSSQLISLHRRPAATETGQFRCEIPDASGTLVNLFINIIVITAQLVRSSIGPILAGHTGFSLRCDVTGTENLNTPTFTYQWQKNGQVISGQQGSTLSLSPLTISNAGEYNCSVTVSSTSLGSTVTVNSNNTDILSLLLFQSNMSLTSNSTNPILSGSDVTLTCTVELSPVVDVRLIVNVEWNGLSTKPATLNIDSTSQESLSIYRFTTVLKSVKTADSRQYTCTTEVVSGIKMSASINIEIVDRLFQLRLKGINICTQWYITRSSKEAVKYVNYIDMALVEAVKLRCKCPFPFTNLLEGSFSCEESPDLMTYRSALFGTHNFNGSRIVGFIQDWVSSGPRIKIDRRSHVRVDSSCQVALTSLDEQECGLI